jgi:DNA-binding CsgD family transcriptional regulator
VSLSITRSDLDQLRRLWSELAEFPVAHAPAALDHALSRLGSLVGVERIWWIGTQHTPIDPENPWRGWNVLMVHYLDNTDDDQATVNRLVERARNNQPPRFHALRAGIDERCHVERPGDLMLERQWYDDWYYNEILHPAGQDAQMVGTYKVDAMLAGHVGMDRAIGARHFSDRDRDLLHVFLAGAPALQQDLFRLQGPCADQAALAPRVREVLRLLLTDLSEKQIAAELGLTVRTTHQYVTSVFRHFGVSGRRGLMSRFLRHDVGHPHRP